MDTQSASIALRHASDLSTSIKSMLISFSPEVGLILLSYNVFVCCVCVFFFVRWTVVNEDLMWFCQQAEKTVSLISELAEVVAQEKSLIEECQELFSIISTLEVKNWPPKANQFYRQEEFFLLSIKLSLQTKYFPKLSNWKATFCFVLIITAAYNLGWLRREKAYSVCIN